MPVAVKILDKNKIIDNSLTEIIIGEINIHH
jgi:serine/threonine protein kinase